MIDTFFDKTFYGEVTEWGVFVGSKCSIFIHTATKILLEVFFTRSAVLSFSLSIFWKFIFVQSWRIFMAQSTFSCQCDVHFTQTNASCDELLTDVWYFKAITDNHSNQLIVNSNLLYCIKRREKEIMILPFHAFGQIFIIVHFIDVICFVLSNWQSHLRYQLKQPVR